MVCVLGNGLRPILDAAACHYPVFRRPYRVRFPMGWKMEHFPLMVPGAPPTGKPVEVRGAFDQQAFATVDTGGEAVVEKALATAYALFRDRDQWLPTA